MSQPGIMLATLAILASAQSISAPMRRNDFGTGPQTARNTSPTGKMPEKQNVKRSWPGAKGKKHARSR
jgi:hypothetical protein